MVIRTLISLPMLALATNAAAQYRLCPSGPGVFLGITGYSCANCEVTTDSGRKVYTFYSEPAVTQVVPDNGRMYHVDGMKLPSWPLVAVGDVIVSVNGHPITTRAGADEFVRPSREFNSLILRRTRNGKTTEVYETTRCRMTQELYDSLQSGRTRQPQDRVMGRFGFAVECHPGCSMRRAADGVFDYKYDGFPEIVQVRPGSVADKSGLKVGDLIVRVDGRSITEAGVLQDAARRDNLRLTLRRDGKELEVLMATKS